MRLFTAITVTVILIIVISPVLFATIINIPDDYSTIQEGINASSDGDTVLVQPGTYVENINFNGHNIVLGSLFLTTGDTSYISSTLIDGNSSGSVVTFESGEDSTVILIGFTIKNGRATNGGGIYCYGSGPIVSQNLITQNRADWHGGGIYSDSSNINIVNNIIYNNSASQGGGGILCKKQSPVIKSNIIINNIVAENQSGYGGGIACYYDESILIQNNIIAHNYVYGFFFTTGGGIDCGSAMIVNNLVIGNHSMHPWGYTGGINGGSGCIVINSIVRNNEPNDVSSSLSISYSNIGCSYPGEGNIDIDPLFRDPDNGDYHLQSITNPDCGGPGDSPCIDAGHPDIIDILLDCDWGLGAERSDMGAYGGEGIPTNIEEKDMPAIPAEFILSQNYPNPFNASTTISYTLPYPSDVTLDIYDILGRKVQTLYNGNQPAGSHSLIWNADGFSSGVYFYKLTAGEYMQAQKMMLLK